MREGERGGVLLVTIGRGAVWGEEGEGVGGVGRCVWKLPSSWTATALTPRPASTQSVPPNRSAIFIY